jgi:hypothetical protein
MKMSILNFQGLRPRMSPRLLDASQAQKAENCDLLSGKLGAIQDVGDVAGLPDALQLSIFKYGASWLSWNNFVKVVQSPIANDTFNRIYYSDSGTCKVRGTLGEFNLGISAPTTAPLCATVAKATVNWTRSWGFYYENTAGEVTQEGTLIEGPLATDVTVLVAGKSFQVTTMPTRVTAAAADRFVLWFDAYDSAGSWLGRVYPDISAYKGQTDFYLDGAIASAAQVNSTAAPNVTFDLTYDTSRASDYEVDRFYVYTYLSVYGEEGPPSTASSVISVDPTQNCNITGLPAAAPAANINKIRVYRTVATDAGTAYQLVIEQAIGIISYLDSKTDDQCGATLLSTEWDAPPAGLTNLVSVPGGFMAGFVTGKRTVYFSEPGSPHAWPDYGISVDYDIIAIAVTENTVIVGTKGATYALTGTKPDEMFKSKLSMEQSCVSQESMVTLNGVVIFASPDGLVTCQGPNGTLITESIYKREQWNAINPASMIADVHDGMYYGWTSSHSVIFNFAEASAVLTTTTIRPTGLYTDLETDTLYLIIGAFIKSWRGGAANLTGTWRSKMFQMAKRWSPSVIQLVADSYPQTVNIYAAEVASPVTVISILGEEAQRIPLLRDEKAWEYEIVFNDDVHSLVVADSIAEVVS